MYTVKELARNIANTDDSHRAAAQRCVRFLKATRNRALTLKGTDKLVLTAWIDSAFASCPITLRSTSGMVIALGSSAVLCRSLTQSTVATSAIIAKDMGGDDARLGDAARKHTELGPEAKLAATTLDRNHARPVDQPLRCNSFRVE